eukprot:1190302-Prorocentrum_minimum.AAC.3
MPRDQSPASALQATRGGVIRIRVPYLVSGKVRSRELPRHWIQHSVLQPEYPRTSKFDSDGKQTQMALVVSECVLHGLGITVGFKRTSAAPSKPSTLQI